MIRIDLERGVVEHDRADGSHERHALASAEGFAIVSKAYVRAGWDAKHVYAFTWLGRPIIQLPEDLMRLGELIWRLQPDLIIEIGVAHGGSLIFCASILNVLGRGRVLGIDIEIRPHNRTAIEQHPLARFITLIEGNSIDPTVVAQARAAAAAARTTLVLLDGCHERDHVLQELRSYAPMVSTDSCIIAMDGVMADVAGAPRTKADWSWNNPREAVRTFLASTPHFVQAEPEPMFNEGLTRNGPTYWGGGWLKRIRPD